MKLSTFPALLLILGWAAVTACSTGRVQSFDPDEQPYVLEEVFELAVAPPLQFMDMDDDGRDEGVEWDPEGIYGRILLRNSDLETIDQVNFSGQVLPPHGLDYDGDGVKEVLVPFVRNDSLFVSVINAKGGKLFHLFLIDGAPREEDGGLRPWDPSINRFYLYDVDHDGRQELITIVNTSYARMPRGILIHSLPDGKVLAKRLIGAFISRAYLGDFDGDNRVEMIVQSSTPNNGAVAGGFDDQHAYLIVWVCPTYPTQLSRFLGVHDGRSSPDT